MASSGQTLKQGWNLQFAADRLHVTERYATKLEVTVHHVDKVADYLNSWKGALDRADKGYPIMMRSRDKYQDYYIRHSAELKVLARDLFVDMSDADVDVKVDANHQAALDGTDWKQHL